MDVRTDGAIDDEGGGEDIEGELEGVKEVSGVEDENSELEMGVDEIMEDDSVGLETVDTSTLLSFQPEDSVHTGAIRRGSHYDG